jgi:predicted hydrocarbon binding protein
MEREKFPLIIPYPVRTGKHPPSSLLVPPSNARAPRIRLTSPIPYATFLRADSYFRERAVSLQATGKYLPDRWMFHFREALTASLGLDAASSVFHAVPSVLGMPAMSAKGLEKSTDFSCYAATCASVLDFYGEEGSRSILRRAGQSAFTRLLQSTAAMAGADLHGFRAPSAPAPLEEQMQSIVRLLVLLSDINCEGEPTGGEYRFRIFSCPECAGREATGCLCHSMAGMLQAALDWYRTGSILTVSEIQCIAQGASQCEFSLAEKP